MDGPGAFADTVCRFRHAKWRGAIQVSVQITARLKAIMNAVHQAFAHLVGEAITLKDDGVVIIERLDEVHFVPKRGDEFLKSIDGLT